MSQEMCSIIVPTRHEADNIGTLFKGVAAALDARAWELIFVDDSDDETTSAISSLTDTDPRVRLIHRPKGSRPGGLGGAVVAGIAAARTDLIVVMDADLQHPPEVLPDLIAAMADSATDVVVASRYTKAGATDGLDGWFRVTASRVCRSIAYAALPRTRRVTDPLGGFFALRRRVVDGVTLQPHGYKILLEILVRGRWGQIAEVPYVFKPRSAGESKSSVAEARRFLRHVGTLRGVLPAKPLAVPAAATGHDSGSPLRVLILTSEAAPVISGIATTVSALKKGLTELGHHVDVVSRADFPRFIRHEIRVSAFGLFWPRFRRSLAPYDVVNLHGPVPTISEVFLLLSRTLHRAHRPAIVYTHHSDLAIPRLERWCAVYNRLSGRLAHLADIIVVSSADYQVKMGRATGVPVAVIPWGIIGTDSAPAPARQPRTEGPLKVLFVGQLRPYKGVGVLLDAVRGADQLQLTVIGDGPERPELEARAAIDTVAHVAFRGRVSDDELRRAYVEHDVVALPSTTTAEAYGLVLAEGMALGCVPVASDLPGVRGVAGATGLLVPPGDVAALRGALMTLADRPELRIELSRASSVRARSMTVSAMAENYEAAFRSGLGSTMDRQARLALPHGWHDPDRFLQDLVAGLGVAHASLSLLARDTSRPIARVWRHGAPPLRAEAPVADYVGSVNKAILIQAGSTPNRELQSLLRRPEITSAIVLPVRRSRRAISVVGISTVGVDGRRLGPRDLQLAMDFVAEHRPKALTG